MKSLRWQTILLLTGMLGAITAYATAQDPPKPITQSTVRYEFLAHSFETSGEEYEIYIKLDQYTGKTWRFHASTMKWTEIEEPKVDVPRPDKKFRYELHAHDYTLNGEPIELIMRADVISGSTWIYMGTYKGWRKLT